ncbi:MAG: extensin family protein [Rhizobiaceae bacterium]|nr:extensin family protein [Rhizobiaceae bacterium]
MEWRRLCVLACLMAASVAHAAERRSPVRLPAAAPLPTEKPGYQATSGVLTTETPPLPEARPDGAIPDAEASQAPTPVARPKTDETNEPAQAVKPAAAGDHETPDTAAKPEPHDKPVYEADARSGTRAAASLPAEEVACRTRLAELGVVFDVRPEEHDAAGCALPYPLSVKKLAKVELRPPALMNCTMAEAIARFSKDVVQPAAQARLGDDFVAIEQASAYVCRPRHGTVKLSEHAFGNALDIAAFTMGKGAHVTVSADAKDKDALFLTDVRKAACGPFKTVLGPGSDADHATHFHLDLAPRRNGGTYCK